MEKNLSLTLLFTSLFSSVVTAQALESDKPILVIGASLGNGTVPFNAGLESPLGGSAVAHGSFLDLGDALVRKDKFVINEAQAGGTTQQRVSCGPVTGTCGTAYWDSYATQLQRAIIRVTLPDGALNADYVLISTPNDCLHPNDRGLAWDQTSPCTTVEFNAFADRMIAVGQEAINNGLVPIYESIPPWKDADLQTFAEKWGFPWVNSEAGLSEMRSLMETRLANELSEYIYLDVWAGFEHIGDGIHPNAETTQKAAERILEAIDTYEAQQ